MSLILSGTALVSCDSSIHEFNDNYPSISAEKKGESKYGQLYTFTVTARNWNKLSLLHRYVKIHVPDINTNIIEKGCIILYMNEGDKHIVLPFIYYQMKRATLFEPFYKLGHIYIHVFGGFILNNSITYSFQVLVVNARGSSRLKKSNLGDFKETSAVLNLDK